MGSRGLHAGCPPETTRELKGHTPETSQRGPRPTTHTHKTSMYALRHHSQTTGEELCAQLASTHGPQYTPMLAGTQRQPPGHKKRPRRGVLPPDSTRAHTSFARRYTRYTHSERQGNRQTVAANHVHTHTSSRHRKQTTLGRGHVRSHPAPGTHRHLPPTHRQEIPGTPPLPAPGTTRVALGPLPKSSRGLGVEARTGPLPTPPPP